MLATHTRFSPASPQKLNSISTMSNTSSPATTNSMAECPTSTTTASSPCLFDVPALDNDNSTISCSSGVVGPTPSAPTLNPEAAWFDFHPDLFPAPEPICFSPPAPELFYPGSPPVTFNDFTGPPSVFPAFQNPVPVYPALPLAATTATTADDLKL